MSYDERFDDYFLALACAVYGDELAKARAILGEMHSVGLYSEAIRKARRTVDPLPQSELAQPIVLPFAAGDPDPFVFSRRKTAPAARRRA